MIEPKLRISSPGDLVAAVPYLLGFTPVDSLVVVGLQQRRVIFQLRLDIPDVADQGAMAEYVASVVARQGVTGALVLGYGSEAMVDPVVGVVRAALDANDVSVLEMLRVSDGRYWSYVCSDPDCCPGSGTPFDLGSSRVAAEATFVGLAAPGAREDLVARLAPVTGEERIEMARARALAEVRLARLLGSAGAPGSATPLLREGMSAVDRAVETFAADRSLSADDIAWLSLLLVNVPVRDYAWDLVGQDIASHVKLWTDVVRRASVDLAAAPATLLAFAAWRGGEGATASIALDRAFQADADYNMAHLLRQAIDGGISPREYDDLMEHGPTRRAGVRQRPKHAKRGRRLARSS